MTYDLNDLPVTVWSNPGEMPPEAFRLIGASSKQSEHPFGRFGTGLKFAIAGSIRLGHDVKILVGMRTYQFSVRPVTLREKNFLEVCCSQDGGEQVPLGFTTDMGAHWEPWQIYREFHCNALDEGGEKATSSWPVNRPNMTHVCVSGRGPITALMDEASLESFLPLPDPIYRNDALGITVHQIAPGNEQPVVTVRGVKVCEKFLGCHAGRSAFRYDLDDAELTEDRTLLDQHAVGLKIAATIASCENDTVLQGALVPNNYGVESYLPWNKIEPNMVGDAFLQKALDFYGKEKIWLSYDIADMVKKMTPETWKQIQEPTPAAGASWEEILELTPPGVEAPDDIYKATAIIYNLRDQLEAERNKAKYWERVARSLFVQMYAGEK